MKATFSIISYINMLSTLLIFGTLLLTVYIYFSNKLDRRWRYLSNIPGPKGYPVIGNLLDVVLKTTDEVFQSDRKHALEFYPLYKVRLLNIGIVFMSGPEDIELVVTNMKHNSKSEIYDFLHSWLGTGLLTSTGEKWQKRRKILTPAFHFNILKDFLKIFNDETKQLVDVLSENCDKPYIDVKVPITDFTLTSIADTAMGITLGKSDDEQLKYRQSVYKFADITIYRSMRPWLFNNFIYNFSKTKGEEREAVKILHAFTNKVVDTRKKDLKNKDKKDDSYSVRKKLAMLDLLLTYQSEGADISDEGIREEVDTFMFEGHDTTSLALCFLLMILANEKVHQDLVYEEIMDVVGTKTPDFDDLQNLKHMELCIKECLRLYPSVPLIGRTLGEDLTTRSGYTIAKGTDVALSIYDMHHSPRLYDDPEKFDPYRFLSENSKNRHPFAYMPFSAGPRNCIGQKFAMLELKAALCGILQSFKLEPVDTPKDMKFFVELVLRTSNPIRVKFVKRQ